MMRRVAISAVILGMVAGANLTRAAAGTGYVSDPAASKLEFVGVQQIRVPE